jgi:hypothetical protein
MLADPENRLYTPELRVFEETASSKVQVPGRLLVDGVTGAKIRGIFHLQLWLIFLALDVVLTLCRRWLDARKARLH